MALSFDVLERVIEVPDTQTEVTVQTLVDEIRDFEDELSTCVIPKMLNASGKQDLGGSVYVGITMELLDGWRIKFADRLGPDHVHCSVTGGNIVAYDTSGNTQFPLVPSDFVFATITSSSSATLQELSSIQYSSFGGGVTVDVINGAAGTAFPIGTIESPVNNVIDAKTIADTRGFNTIFIKSNITLTTGDDIDGFIVEGESMIKSTIIIETGADVSETEFVNATITGVLDGGNTLRNCIVNELAYVNGHVHDCLINNYTITIAGDDIITFINCWSGAYEPSAQPIFDMGGSGRDLALRAWTGGARIINMDGPNNVIVDMVSGRVIIDDTISAGCVRVRGVGSVIDNSTGTTYVCDGTLSQGTIADAVWDEATIDHVAVGTFGDAIGSGAAGEKDWTAGERSQIRDALGVDGVKATSTGGLVQKIKSAVDAIIAFVS